MGLGLSEIHPGKNEKDWSRRVGLNHRPADYESAALPLSYAGLRRYVQLDMGRENSVFFKGMLCQRPLQVIPLRERPVNLPWGPIDL